MVCTQSSSLFSLFLAELLQVSFTGQPLTSLLNVRLRTCKAHASLGILELKDLPLLYKRQKQTADLNFHLHSYDRRFYPKRLASDVERIRRIRVSENHVLRRVLQRNLQSEENWEVHPTIKEPVMKKEWRL